jgi:hypothetical protein
MTLFKIVHNAQTGEVSEIELNANEIAQKLQDEADFVARQEARSLMEDKKVAALEKLGLTTDELAALLS